MRKEIIIPVILLFLFVSISGQSGSLDIVCEKCSFSEFIEKLERQTSFKFFYDKEDVEGLVIDINEQNTSIESVLAKALNGSNLHYSLIRDSSIVFTGNYPIKTDFSDEYRLWYAKGENKKEKKNDIKYFVESEEKDRVNGNEEFIQVCDHSWLREE